MLAGAEELGPGADAAADAASRPAPGAAPATQAGAGDQPHARGLRAGQGALERLGRLLHGGREDLAEQGVGRPVRHRGLGIVGAGGRQERNAAQPADLAR